MGKLWDLMTVERQELGYREGANNDTKYGAEYGLNYQPWCVMFQWWCAKRAGVPFPVTAHCNGVEQYAKQQGQWVSGQYEVGDFVIFDYDGDGSRDHIGFIVDVENDYCITTEGNYADQVASVKRKYSEFVGAYRPDWKALDGEEEEPAEDEVVSPQSPEGDSSPCDKGSLDEEGDKGSLPEVFEGDFGPAVVAVQVLLKYNHGCSMPGSFTWKGIPDGEFGPEVKACLKGKFGKEYVDGDVWKKLIGGIG